MVLVSRCRACCSRVVAFCVVTICVGKVITFCVEKLHALHFVLTFLLHFVSMLLHFAAILVAFCVDVAFCGDYYILWCNKHFSSCTDYLSMF